MIAAFHEAFFGVSEESLLKAYFNFLAHYKILTLIFIVAPYIALKIMF